MIYTTIDNFFLTDEALENSPSRRDGIDRDTENTLRMYGCELIQEAGILLAFEQAVMATAQVLFHRFYCKRSMKAFNVKKVAATALWEGAKLEEVKEVSTEPGLLLRMVMIAIDRCTARREMPEGRKLPVLDIHSKEGEEFRRSLIRYELEMLKAFGFITHVEHPHKQMLNFCQLLKVDAADLKLLASEDSSGPSKAATFMQEVWNVANDSLRTTLCVRFKSSVVACGIIFYTARKFKVPLPEDPPWWELFNVQLPHICEVCRALHDLYRAPKPEYIPVCHQLLPSKPPTPQERTTAGGSKADDSGATPELSSSRPAGRPLDPSVRRLPGEVSAGGLQGGVLSGTPSQGAAHVANGKLQAAPGATPAGAAGDGSGVLSAGPSPAQPQPAAAAAAATPGSAQRKRPASVTPHRSPDPRGKRHQPDLSHRDLAAPSRTAPAAAGSSGGAAAAGAQQQQQPGRKAEDPAGQRQSSRQPASRDSGKPSVRSRSRSRDRDKEKRRRSRSRSRDRDKERATAGRPGDRAGREGYRDGKDSSRHHRYSDGRDRSRERHRDRDKDRERPRHRSRERSSAGGSSGRHVMDKPGVQKEQSITPSKDRERGRGSEQGQNAPLAPAAAAPPLGAAASAEHPAKFPPPPASASNGAAAGSKGAGQGAGMVTGAAAAAAASAADQGEGPAVVAPAAKPKPVARKKVPHPPSSASGAAEPNPVGGAAAAPPGGGTAGDGAGS